MKKRNLIVVRAGDNSLHPFWMSKKERNWDLFLSYYGDISNPYNGLYDYFHQFKGSKWEGLNDLLRNHSNIIENYDYIWIPDDDILTDCENINNFFYLNDYFGFGISQPALTLYSHISHKITLKHCGLTARETNFVEIMMPCFSKACLNLVSSTFQENSSGWGLEWLWGDICKKNNLRLGIIDGITVFHARPVGSAGHGGASNPQAELEEIIKKYQLHKYNPKNKKYYKYNQDDPIPNTPTIIMALLNKFLVSLHTAKIPISPHN